MQYPLLAHITFNEVALVLGVFLLGFAVGVAVAWQIYCKTFRRD